MSERFSLFTGRDAESYGETEAGGAFPAPVDHVLSGHGEGKTEECAGRQYRKQERVVENCQSANRCSAEQQVEPCEYRAVTEQLPEGANGAKQ